MNKLIFIAMLLSSSHAISQTLVCTEFEGKWEGNKVGAGYQIPITINFQANCKYEWVETGGISTTGFITLKSDEIWYANRAGSRGKVKKDGNELTWVNVWTGKNYEVKVKR